MSKLAMLTLTVAALLSGCKTHTAFVSSSVDPTVVLEKTAPIFVTLPERPTIRERQLVVALREEMCRSGFNLAPSLDESKWTMGLSFSRRTYEFGSRSSAVAIPVGNTAVVLGSSTPQIHSESAAFLYLFRSEDVAAGKPLSVWEGSISSASRVFSVYEPTIFHNVLRNFGKNIERPTKLSKSYARDVKKGEVPGCPA